MNALTTILQTYPLLLQGARLTLLLWLAATTISLILGTSWGIVRCRQLRPPLLAIPLDFISFLIRGIPFYVQLLMAYFVIPDLLNINIPATTAAIISLGLCSAAYVSQIVRGALNALPPGQWIAAKALGYSTLQTLQFIIVPQMVRAALPSLINEFDQLLKSTSIISAIGIFELTHAGMNIIARTMTPVPIYLAIAVLYLCMSSVLNGIGFYLERKLWRQS